MCKHIVGFDYDFGIFIREDALVDILQDEEKRYILFFYCPICGQKTEVSILDNILQSE